MKPWIFITGGCGYIGSHIAAELKRNNEYNVMIIDRRAKELQHTWQFSDTYADEDFASDVVRNAIIDYKPISVIHCAATSTIIEGVRNPIGTWDNNVTKTLSLIDACITAGVKSFIFASTSAVYDDKTTAIDENHTINPINSYAASKLAVEYILRDCFTSHGLSSVSLRLFNVAGAHDIHSIGELHGSSHILSRIMEAAVHDIPINVYGRDWDTRDGTAIRDYVHVMDVATAFNTAIGWSNSAPGAHIFNIGNGIGTTVQEMLNSTEDILGSNIPYRYIARRNGDSSQRFADISLAQQSLQWNPIKNLNSMITDSIKWYNGQTYKNLTAAGIMNS